MEWIYLWRLPSTFKWLVIILDLFKIGIYYKSINHIVLLDAPEILVNRNWVHAGLGSFAELECNVYAKPMAQVKLNQFY